MVVLVRQRAQRSLATENSACFVVFDFVFAFFLHLLQALVCLDLEGRTLFINHRSVLALQVVLEISRVTFLSLNTALARLAEKRNGAKLVGKPPSEPGPAHLRLPARATRPRAPSLRNV